MGSASPPFARGPGPRRSMRARAGESYFKSKGTNVIRRDSGQRQTAPKKALAPEMEMTQYTQFPDWVSTEEDMEQYFKLKGTKVSRVDSGNGGVNPSGRHFHQVPETQLIVNPAAKPGVATPKLQERLAALQQRIDQDGVKKFDDEDEMEEVKQLPNN